MIQLYPLYRLQQVDSKIDHLLGKINAGDDSEELQKKIRIRDRKLQATEKELHALKTQLKDTELKLATVESHIKDFEKKLYSGKTTNPKELASFTTEIDLLKAQKSGFEDTVLELMDKVETTKTEAATVKTRLDKGKKDLEQHGLKSGTVKHEAEAQLEELRKKRDEMAAEIEHTLISLYERLRKRRQGIAVARLEQNACGECGTGLPESVRRRVQERQLEVCSYCERILFTD